MQDAQQQKKDNVTGIMKMGEGIVRRGAGSAGHWVGVGHCVKLEYRVGS